MAHKKGQGSSRNGRDSNAQRRGVKVYGGEKVSAGSILVRQLGTVIHPGVNVKLGRDSNSQRRGIKVYGGEKVSAGAILVRQVGSTIAAGKNVGLAKDFTLFALVDGVVKYERKGKDKKKVSVYPDAAAPTAQA